MKEFKSKVSSTWSDGMQKGEAITQRQSGDEVKGKKWQLDHIIGPIY